MVNCLHFLLIGIFFFQLVSAGGPSQPDRQLRLGEWNVQVFGDTKWSDLTVRGQLISIFRDIGWDVMLFQEIRDAAAPFAIDSLLASLQSDVSPSYRMVLGPREGRTASKEQYAYIYRSDRVSVDQWYVFDDNATLWFERPPIVGAFSSLLPNPSGGNLAAFSMVGCHVKPTDAVAEMDHLVQVYADALSRLPAGYAQAVVLGDFNADCSYVSQAALATLALRTDPRFTWLISDADDTTVAVSSCAYDRIVVTGLIAEGASARTIFLYDADLGLTNSEASAVSDHYPVFFDLDVVAASSGAGTTTTGGGSTASSTSTTAPGSTATSTKSGSGATSTSTAHAGSSTTPQHSATTTAATACSASACQITTTTSLTTSPASNLQILFISFLLFIHMMM